MINEDRIKSLNKECIKKGKYVLYWLQASQRTEYNHALEYAIMRANELGQPLLVFFGLTDDFPDANSRHYAFMLEGLLGVEDSLRDRGIKMVIGYTSPEKGALELSDHASLVVTDRGYLRIQRGWRDSLAKGLDCPLIQVETDVVVPVEEASDKEEWSAWTLRRKITPLIDKYLTTVDELTPDVQSTDYDIESLDIDDKDDILGRMNIDDDIKTVDYYKGGTEEAKEHLQDFIENRLEDYDEKRNDPTRDVLSNMSPYLHFGQISPVYIAREVMTRDSPSVDAYLEELIVRRELSMNFVYYNEDYDSYNSLPDWAEKTLNEHRDDRREYIYDLEEFEKAGTHDPYWNSAQIEMVITGKMHGYMRMYWGKKILEWTETPEDAYRIALYLNNKYELDGRDPNGFAGVAWCLGKHDRAWKERPVFGKVRYMNDRGLKRKFDADGYVQKIKEHFPE